MFITDAIKRLTDYWHQLPVRWTTVALFAIVIAYSDGFYVTVVQGTIGAIERNQPPLMRWLHDSTLMLPLFFLAVLVALLGARRWFARRQQALVQAGVAALLVALISGGVGIAEVGVSSLTDYQYQVQHLELMHSYGAANQPGSTELAGFGSAAPLAYNLYCDLRGIATDSAVALMEYATLMVHVRAMYISVVVLLTTNLMIAAAMLAVRKGRLWSTQLAQVNETTNQLSAGAVALS